MIYNYYLELLVSLYFTIYSIIVTITAELTHHTLFRISYELLVISSSLFLLFKIIFNPRLVRCFNDRIMVGVIADNLGIMLSALFVSSDISFATISFVYKSKMGLLYLFPFFNIFLYLLLIASWLLYVYIYKDCNNYERI